MRTLIGMGLLIFCTGNANAQSMTCKVWANMFDSMSRISAEERGIIKTLYVSGFSDGVGSAVAYNIPSSQTQNAIAKTWPLGLSIAQVVALLDEYCNRPGTSNTRTLEAIHHIAREIEDRRRPN